MTRGKSSSVAWNIFRNVSPQKERKKEKKRERNDSNEYKMDGKSSLFECTFYELLFDFDDKMVEILVKYEYDTRSQFFNKLCE